MRLDVERGDGKIFPKLAKNVAKAVFSFKLMLFKIAPKVVEYLGNFSATLSPKFSKTEIPF